MITNSIKYFVILFVFLVVVSNHYTINGHESCSHQSSSDCRLEAVWTDNPPKPIKSKFHKYVKGADGVQVVRLKSCAATSDITVEYDSNFPSAAQAACDFAIEIWEQYIISDNPIHIIANWDTLGTGSLGFGGPRLAFGPSPLQPNVLYPLGLWNSILDNDFDTGNEINLVFNAGRSDWYFGTDGNTPIQNFDFVSVAMHEIGHGLGFVNSSRQRLTTPDSSSTNLIFGMPSPIIYDSFIETGNGTLIVSLPEGSASLSSALASDDLFLGGTETLMANSNNPAKIMAPNPFNNSSIGHWDELTFNNTDNALMTPSLFNGEAIHDPGPLMLAVFKDMGWNISSCGQSTCTDGIQNQGEQAIDCGGPCTACITGCDTDVDAYNYVTDADIDEACETCFDGIQNGDEGGVDCGGTYPGCPSCATCADGIQNQGELAIDCGGPCTACITGCDTDVDAYNYVSEADIDEACETCFDGIQNGDEGGVDCGGTYPGCQICPCLEVFASNFNQPGPCVYDCNETTSIINTNDPDTLITSSNVLSTSGTIDLNGSSPSYWRAENMVEINVNTTINSELTIDIGPCVD